MDAGSEGENDKKANQGRADGPPKRPKRQMKTPFQLEELEKTYAVESHPCEATRAGLSEKLGLTDRQLQMWFCHRRLKDKEAVDVVAMKPHPTVSGGRKGLNKSPKELVMAEPGSGPTRGSGSSSGSGSGSGSSQFDNGNDTPVAPTRYHETPWIIIKHRAMAGVEAQLGEPLREDGPILGMEFDELPPGAFGAPIVPVTEQQDRYRSSYGSKVNGQYNVKHMKASSTGPLEAEKFKIRANACLQAPSSYINHSPLDGAIAKGSSLLYGHGFLPQEHGDEQVKSMDLYSQPIRQVQLALSQRNADFITHTEHPHIERKRKNSDVQIGREAQAHEKKIRKELEKQDLLRRKREEIMRKEMERQERERQKEEQRIMREQQRQEEIFQREERREMERREKLMQKEILWAERMKQKEDRRRERERSSTRKSCS